MHIHGIDTEIIGGQVQRLEDLSHCHVFVVSVDDDILLSLLLCSTGRRSKIPLDISLVLP
jgi:hypothetical protein